MVKYERSKGVTVNVVHGNTECLTIFSNTKIAKHMVGYGLVAKDLKLCLACIGELRELQKRNETQNIRWALYIAFHTTYGKCFVQALGRKIKLEARDFVPKEDKKIHEKILTLRHKYTAHGGGYEEMGVAPIGLNPDLENKKVLDVGPPFCLHISRISEHDMRLYERLINKILEKVEKKIEENRTRLLEEAQASDIDVLYEIAINC